MQVQVRVQVTSVRGQPQVPVLGEYPPVAIGSGWVPAYLGTQVLPQDVRRVSVYEVGGGGSA